MTGSDEMDVLIARAWDNSVFSRLPDDFGASLAAVSERCSLHAGETVKRDRVSHLHLVADGLLRDYLTSPSARQITLRYLRPGAVIGLAAAIGWRGATPFERLVEWTTIEALRDTTLLRVPWQVFDRRMREDPAVSMAVIEELGAMVRAFQGMIYEHAFAPVRQRVAHHLIELAVDRGDEDGIVANHEQIARSVGSVREVVCRVLKGLETDELVRRRGQRIVLVDAVALQGVAAGSV